MSLGSIKLKRDSKTDFAKIDLKFSSWNPPRCPFKFRKIPRWVLFRFLNKNHFQIIEKAVVETWFADSELPPTQVHQFSLPIQDVYLDRLQSMSDHGDFAAEGSQSINKDE